MTYPEPTRRRLRAGASAVLVLGLLALGFGVRASAQAQMWEPVPVPTGDAVRVPESPMFSGPVALYGVVRGGAAPDVSCSLTTADGTDATAALSAAGPAGLPRRVVEGHALEPLLVVGEPGGTVRCAGAAAAVAQPLYLIGQEGQAAMAPMAAFSVAVLALALGGTGVLAFRRTDEAV